MKHAFTSQKVTLTVFESFFISIFSVFKMFSICPSFCVGLVVLVKFVLIKVALIKSLIQIPFLKDY